MEITCLSRETRVWPPHRACCKFRQCDVPGELSLRETDLIAVLSLWAMYDDLSFSGQEMES